jgi:hypothetical protein
VCLVDALARCLIIFELLVVIGIIFIIAASFVVLI